MRADAGRADEEKGIGQIIQMHGRHAESICTPEEILAALKGEKGNQRIRGAKTRVFSGMDFLKVSHRA